MNHRTLKVGISIVAGLAAGYVVYKGVKGGYGLNGNNNQQPQQPEVPDYMKTTVNIVNDTLQQQKAQEPQETKKDIVISGLRSAINICLVAGLAGKCMTTIYDSVGAMSNMTNTLNKGNINEINNLLNQNQYGQNYNYAQKDNQSWNRMNPFVVTTGGDNVNVNNNSVGI